MISVRSSGLLAALAASLVLTISCGGGSEDPPSSALDGTAPRATASPTRSSVAPTPRASATEVTATVVATKTAGIGRLIEAHMASAVDANADEPDKDTYSDTFPVAAKALYVVYRVSVDAKGTVLLTWKRNGEVLYEDTFVLSGSQTWAFGGVTPAPGGFEPGSYDLVLEFNGEKRVLEFAVE